MKDSFRKSNSPSKATLRRQAAARQLDNLLGRENRLTLVEAVQQHKLAVRDILDIAVALRDIKQYGQAVGYQGLPPKSFDEDNRKCIVCGNKLILRSQKLDQSVKFWGCSAFPACRYTVKYIP